MGKKNLGKTFLFSKKKDFSQIDGGTGYTYSDGSGYFDGDSGEKIQIYSDGSGYYEDSNGGKGTIYSDGSGYYEGSDGSKAYKYSDGSGYFEDKNGNITNYYAEEDNDYLEDNEEDDESLGELLGEALFVAGALGIKKIKNKIQETNEEEIKRQQIIDRKERRKKKIKDNAKKSRHKRVKAFLFNNKKIMVGANSEDFKDEKYIITEKWFKEVGFNNIEKKALEDIYIEDEDKQYKVSEVSINGITKFNEKDMFSYDSNIIILYHSKKKIAIPFSSKYVYKKNCEEIISTLKQLGFTKIKRIELDDLVTGWINKEDSIQTIKINTSDKFNSNQSFYYDAEIEITYHTFTKKKRMILN